MMKRACFSLLLGQGEVALGVLVDLLMYITCASDGLLVMVEIVEFVCALRRAVYRVIPRPSLPQPALLLLVTTV